MELISISDLKVEREEKLRNCKTSKTSKKVREKYDTLILYLESAPNPQFVASEIKRLKKQIEVNNERFWGWVVDHPKETKNKTETQMRTLYNAKFGTTVARQQIKNLQLLIK